MLPPILRSLPNLDLERENVGRIARDATKARVVNEQAQMQVQQKAFELEEARKQAERAARVRATVDTALKAATGSPGGASALRGVPNVPTPGGGGVDARVGSALAAAGLGADGVGHIRAGEEHARADEQTEYDRGRQANADRRTQESHDDGLKTSRQTRSIRANQESRAQESHGAQKDDRARRISKEDTATERAGHDRQIALTTRMSEAAAQGDTARVRVIASVLETEIGAKPGTLAGDANIQRLMNNARYREGLVMAVERYAGNEAAMAKFLEAYIKTGDEQAAAAAAGVAPTARRSIATTDKGMGEVVNGVFIPYEDQNGNPIYPVSKPSSAAADRTARDMDLANEEVRDRLVEYAKAELVATGIAVVDALGEVRPAEGKEGEYSDALAKQRAALEQEIYAKYGVGGSVAATSTGGGSGSGGAFSVEGSGTEAEPFKPVGGTREEVEAWFTNLPSGSIFVNPADGELLRKP